MTKCRSRSGSCVKSTPKKLFPDSPYWIPEGYTFPKKPKRKKK